MRIGRLEINTGVVRNGKVRLRPTFYCGRFSNGSVLIIWLVEQVSPGPYLEMFARRNRLGWETWGNECLRHVEVET
jgi:hypothetical protein